MRKAIILCSGGLDSVVTAHYVKKNLNYKRMIILFFNYSQRSLKRERYYSKKCAKELHADFVEIPIKYLADISDSFINKDVKHKIIFKADLKNTKEEGKRWYVPCRNLIFLSNALSLAESYFLSKKVVFDIFVGFKCEGEDSYLDTTQKFLNSLNKLSAISCTYPFMVLAPLIRKDKEDIVLLGLKLGINLKNTYSCYTSDKEHCGTCLSCRLRQQSFYWANFLDPTIYRPI